MILKLMTGNGRARWFPCDHVTQSLLPDRTEVELSTGEVLVLPRDGDRIYILDHGVTADTIRSPKGR
jgi:hypothetical protein